MKKSVLWMAPIMAVAVSSAALAGPKHHKLDLNDDGKISMAEAEAMHMKMFAKMDKDGDGQFTMTEANLKSEKYKDKRKAKMAKHMEKRFQKLDTDASGSVSKDEFMAARKAHFMKVDVNSDGFIDKDEHMAMREKRKAKWKAMKEKHKAEHGDHSH